MLAACPVCGSRTLLEFYEPAGAALCADCGHILRWFCDRFSLRTLLLETRLGDLGADSLDLVELVMEIEEEFSVSLPDESIDESLTIGRLINMLMRLRHEEAVTD